MGLIAPFQNGATVCLHYALSLPKQAGTNLSGRGTCICLVLYMITTSVSFIYNPQTINWVFSRINIIASSRISVSRIY